MVDRQAESVLHGLCKLVEAQAAQLTDGQLLDRFTDHRDEAAFAALVHRYGRLVYGVCRNVLRHDHDAEDAFQATFLVLARKAGVIRKEHSVGSWLYRVAYRVATKARVASERRRQREYQSAKSPELRPTGDLAWRELQAMLDHELNRLPTKYRTPFVLCCLLGKSKSEVATELAWKEGTVSSRLSHARKLLQARLARRGVLLSALLSGLAISETSGAGSVPAALPASTQKLTFAFTTRNIVVAGPEPLAASLAHSVLRSDSLARPKFAMVTLLVMGVAGASIAVALRQRPTPTGPPPGPTVAISTQPNESPAPAIPAVPTPGKKMIVRGSVVGPDGAAVPGTKVAVTASLSDGRRSIRGTDPLNTLQLGDGTLNADGQYSLAVPQTTSWNRGLAVLAAAPGYALTFQRTEPSSITATDHDLQPIRLVPGLSVRGRLVDHAGNPAKKVQVHVLAMMRNGASWLNAVYYQPPEPPPPGWPTDIFTDDDGGFTLPDIGPDTQVQFQVRDDRFAREWYTFTAPKAPRMEPFVFTLAQPCILEGSVKRQDTGQPMPDATVIVESYQFSNLRSLVRTTMGHTDANGRYRISVFPGDRVEVIAYPPDGVPYLMGRADKNWPKGSQQCELDVPVVRGILVKGTITDAGTGKPIAGVHYWHEWWLYNNPSIKLVSRNGNYWPSRGNRTGTDGEFSIAVPPGPGTLLFKASDPDYVKVEIPSGQLDGEGRGGAPNFPDAVVPLRLKAGEQPEKLSVQLRRGVTVRGQVWGSDGKPVPNARLISPTYVPTKAEFEGETLAVRNGGFELPGCDPEGTAIVCCYNPAKSEGAIAEFKVDSPNPPQLRLARCVSVHAKVVGAAATVKTPPNFVLELVVRPGDSAEDSIKKGTKAAISVRTHTLVTSAGRPFSAGNGVYVLSNLIPGATYFVRTFLAGFEPDVVSFTAPLIEGETPTVVTIDLRPQPKRK